MDTVIEILNSAGARLGNCLDPGIQNPPPPIVRDRTPGQFDDPCMNDDIDFGYTSDSQLQLKVPGAGVVTVYLHVFDWYGRARPDYIYQVQVAGAN